MSLKPGDRAPDFTLTHRIGEDPVRLSSELEKGKAVLLFYPLAFSSVCTDEVCAVAQDWSGWEALGARVLGISVDSPFVNARFSDETRAPFPLLSDFNRDAATSYGVRNDDFFGMKGVANRSAFVVNQDGTIAWAWVTDDPAVMPDFDAIREALKG